MPPVLPSRPRRKATSKPSKLSTLLKHDRTLLAARQTAGFAMDGLLIGLDEVGRGSLIGPVVGGAVCLPPTLTRPQRQALKWLDDSKKLSAPIRAELAEAIRSFCQVGIGVASQEEIDELNIHYASLLALYRAFLALCRDNNLCPETSPAYLLMDGRAVIPDLCSTRQQAIIKGDGKSAAIAAASIIAKEHRDTLCKGWALEYPGYDWENNMGYGTPAHLKGIQELGVTPLHRRHFKQVHQQLSLFDAVKS